MLQSLNRRTLPESTAAAMPEPRYGPEPVSKEEADESRARAAAGDSTQNNNNHEKRERRGGGKKKKGEDARPAEDAEEETPWWAKWQIMVPVIAGAAVLGLVCSALLSEGVHKQVVDESELKSRAASALSFPCLNPKLSTGRALNSLP